MLMSFLISTMFLFVRSCLHARALPDEMESRLVHDVQNCKGLDLTLPCRHLVSVNAHKIILNNNY